MEIGDMVLMDNNIMVVIDEIDEDGTVWGSSSNGESYEVEQGSVLN